MSCCKSNNAVITKKDEPKVVPKDEALFKEHPQEQAPPVSESKDSSYGNFLAPNSPEPSTIAAKGSSTILSSEDVTTVYADPTKSLDLHQYTTEDIDNLMKDLPPQTQTKSTEVPIPPIQTAASSDDITEVYTEPPKVPKDSFVYLPDVPQRGYEPWGLVSYASKDEWKKTKPYRIGTLVWYRNTTDPGDTFRRFKWYIPGVIEDYVLNEDDKDEVIGYKIGFTEKPMRDIDQYFLDLLKCADPKDVMLRWDEKTPPCPVDGIDDIASENDAEKRMSKLVAEFGDDLGFQGAKQNGLGPHMWAMTMTQLRAITTDPKYNDSMSMYDVIKNIVKPQTQGTGLGYALYLNKEKPLRAKYMVSHAWGENYSQFLSALSESNCDGPFWVCAMAICQNNDVDEVTIEKQLGPDPQYGPFATVLKQADSMIAIMTQSCDIYSRLWCVYEIYVAISLNIPVTLQSYNEITGYGGSDKMYSNVVLDSTGTPVETRNASCGYDADKQMIEKEIMKLSGGFDLIDDVVMWVRIKTLIDDMARCERLMWTETQMPVPIGTCSASNIASRQNAGIANALKVWQDARIARRMNQFTPKERGDDESVSSLGYFTSFIRDKLCSGSSYF